MVGSPGRERREVVVMVGSPGRERREVVEMVGSPVRGEGKRREVGLSMVTNSYHGYPLSTLDVVNTFNS